MTPAEELRAAAVKLREMAAAATSGPWEIEYGYAGHEPQAVFVMDPTDPDDVDSSIGIGCMNSAADNVWIALMGPDKAALLADWLESSAKTTEAMLATWQRNPLELTDPHALAFARSILGGTEGGGGAP